MNGLTKALPRGWLAQFFKQLGLEYLEAVIRQRREAELTEEERQMDDFFVDEDTNL